MSFKQMILYCGIVTLLINAVSGVKAAPHSGANLPLLGDVKTAIKFVNAGASAASAGRVQEAMEDYKAALAASPFYEDAELGLARCATAEGDYATAIENYRDVIDNHHEEYDIDVQAEYILVLSQTGQDQEAVPVYNHIVDLCKKGRYVSKMEIVPPDFSADSSDYDPNEMQAMTHLIRAMNSNSLDYARMSSEIQKAEYLAPNSSLVYFYEGWLLDGMKQEGAKAAFQQALALDDGTNAKVIKKWIALSKS